MARKELTAVVGADVRGFRDAMTQLRKDLKDVGKSVDLTDASKKFDLISEAAISAKDKAREFGRLLRELGDAGWQDSDLFGKTAQELAKAQASVKSLKDYAREAAEAMDWRDRLAMADASASDLETKFRKLTELGRELAVKGDTEGMEAVAKEAAETKARLDEAAEARKRFDAAVSAKVPDGATDSVEERLAAITEGTKSLSKRLAELRELGASLVVSGDSEGLERVAAAAEETRARMEAATEAGRKFDELAESKAPMEERLRRIKEGMTNVGDRQKALTELLKRFKEEGRDVGSKAYREAEAELRRCDELLKMGITDTRRLADEAAKVSFKEAATSLAGIGTAVTGIAGLFGGLGDTAAQNIQKMVGAATALDGLKTGLAGAGPALANPWVLAGAAALGAGSAFVKYNENLQETMQRTAQLTGLTGGELASLRNGIQACADTWGKDYGTVLDSVDQMTAQYGISGEKALEIISKGFRAGADDSGKMLEMMKRYAPAFHDMGISAEELTAIIANTRSGIFSEGGMDLISKAGQKLRLMSKSTAEAIDGIGLSSDEMLRRMQSGELKTVDAMRMVSARLKETGVQSREAGEVMKEVFGRKAAEGGYELVKALADVETELDVIKGQTGEHGEIMEELQNANRDLQDALSAMFGVAGNGFAEWTNVVKTKVLRWTAELVNKIIELYNESMAFRGAIYGVRGVFVTLWEVARTVLRNIAAGFEGLCKIVDGLLDLDPSKMAEGYATMLKAVKDNFKDAGKAIADEWAADMDRIKNSRIDKVPAPAGGDEADGRPLGTFGSEGRGHGHDGGKSGKTGKTESVEKVILEADDGSLEAAEKKLKAWTAKSRTIRFDDADSLAECGENIREWTREVESRKIGLELSLLGLDSARREMESLREEKATLDPVLDEGRMAEVEARLAELSQREILLRAGLTLDDAAARERLDAIAAEIAEIGRQRIEVDPETDPQKWLELRERADALSKEEREIRFKIVEQGPDPLGRLDAAEKKVAEIKAKINPFVDPEGAAAAKAALEAITARKAEIEARTEGTGGEGPLAGVRKEIARLENFRLTLDPELDPEAVRRVNAEIAALNGREIELKARLGIESLPTITQDEAKAFAAGSAEDMRRSLAAARAAMDGLKQDFKDGIVPLEEAERKIDEINAKLEALGLKPIDLKFNADTGQLETFEERVRSALEGQQALTGAISQAAGAFEQLGGAIGGAGGEVVSFAGKSIAAGAQLLQQYAQIVAANEAAALAKGMSSAAGLAFPFNLAAIAAVIGTITSLFSSLPKFETGGIVGGSDYRGDKVLARLNSGEGVLTREGVRNLGALADGGGTGGTVTFRIEGDSLAGALRNRDKTKRRTRR